MTSKTPQFDKTLDEILKELKPHTRKCIQCGVDFRIEKEDIDFYHMLRVPPPTLCPLCRKKRRLGHLMRVPKFFKKPCSAPGHTEEVITVFPPTTPHKIYDFSFYHSDNWDAVDYGRDYDFSRPFFEQFRELFFATPHVPLERDPMATNSEYTVGGSGGARNNYYCGMGYASHDTLYSLDARFCEECVDCNIIWNSELCYESIGSGHCSRCLFVIDSANCMDSAFLYDCKNCSHCFLCSNLRNKKHVFSNKQLTKEEYERRLQGINLGNRFVLNDYLRRFNELMGKSLHRAVLTVNSSNTLGDELTDCRNCYFVFRGKGGENLRFVDNFEQVKDSMDFANSPKSERVYEITVSLGSNNKFSMYLRNATFMEYSSECLNCHYCFGCAGLKNKEFHIFNRPYREDEYWQIVDRIKTDMLGRGEYGEFFPPVLGFMPYQSSYGQKAFPLDEKQAKDMNIPWYDELISSPPAEARILQAPDEIPADINEVDDAILNDVILCEETKKPFRLIKAELDFYKKMHLPLPIKHPWQRIMERSQLEHSIWLYPFKCPKCNKKSYSVYSAEKQKELKIYCESCYLKEVV